MEGGLTEEEQLHHSDMLVIPLCGWGDYQKKECDAGSVRVTLIDTPNGTRYVL